MDHQTDKKANIIKHITDGTIKIDSIQEFQAILDIFPDDPSLHKAFSDLLVRKKSFDAAAESYKKATDLYLHSGMILQAIASKIMEWNLSKPTNQDAWGFYSSLRKCNPPETPFKKFFEKMTYPEMVSILKNSEYVRLPSGKLIQKFGEMEENLYFIVSGTVHEIPSQSSLSGKEIVRKTPIPVFENDFLGKIYPFDKKNTSPSDVETATKSELIKLSKDRLIGLCKKYPDIEMRLNHLYQLRSDPDKDSSSQIVRKVTRYKILMNASVDIFHDESGVSPMVVNGTTSDISLGGICIDLETKFWNDPPLHLIGKTAKTKISLPNESLSLSILGKIVWFKQVSQGGKIVDILGVQFKEMPPKLRGILLVMANIMNEGV
ncbi:MAG: PilZ domain-containing protein [Deltaproteobacteria bacterium]|nr:PilZ domain-containing protein [Deltaproteobacteria bacterium]MBW2364439.1 PilZ domain-containing protein [Deltaproteobacteria bacterium]